MFAAAVRQSELKSENFFLFFIRVNLCSSVVN